MNLRGLFHLLVVYIVWGSTYLAIRIAVREGSGFPAFTMAAMRTVVAAFLLFLSAGLTFLTKAPKSLREKATIISELEPGKLYNGYFIYQSGYVSEDSDEMAAEADKKGSVRSLSSFFSSSKRKTA